MARQLVQRERRFVACMLGYAHRLVELRASAGPDDLRKKPGRSVVPTKRAAVTG
jgi:hypothetical protein